MFLFRLVLCPCSFGCLPAQGTAHGEARGKEIPGVGMNRLVHDLSGRPHLHDPAPVHHSNPVAQVRYQVEIVGNEQVGQRQLLFEVQQQVDDLRLDRDIQVGHRLVEHQELRIHGQGPGHHDALLLAAGELVGESGAVRRSDAHRLQDLPNAFHALLFRHPQVDQTLFQAVADAHLGVQSAVGILEHDLHPAAKGPQLCRGKRPQQRAAETHLAVRRRVQVEDRAGQGGLAAAGLANQPEDRVLLDIQAYPVHRPYGPLAAGHQAAPVELLDQVPNLYKSIHFFPIMKHAA